jgi:regulator of RNase E activity RraA
MKPLWANDEELFTLARRELFTAVVGDVMDKLNLRRQFLPPQIQPLDRRMMAIGRALTVLEADFFEELAAGQNSLSGKLWLMLEALDDLKQNEIYVCYRRLAELCVVGELASLRAQRCGAAGAVVDGYSRDTHGILNSGLTFSTVLMRRTGHLGKVIDFQVPIEIGGARIQPGDILFGNVDGCALFENSGRTRSSCAL